MKKNILDCVIVGGGIVGLSIAYSYQNKFPKHKLIVLEKESQIFLHQSGRNSGVIHSGIYYKPGSLKAENCLKGYQLLIDFAKKNSIPYEITGKLIIATTKSEVINLKKLYNYGLKNGLKNIRLLDHDEILEYEKYCTNAIKAIYVPQSGIIDYKQIGNKLVEILISNGADIKLDNEVNKIQKDNYLTIKTKKNNFYVSKKIIFATGIYSDKFISESLKNKIRMFPFKGEYYKLKDDKKYKVTGLIYPVPDINFPFLGIHLTKTISGDIEVGPNAVLALSKLGYSRLSFNFHDFFKIISWKGFWLFTIKYWKIGLFEIFRNYSLSLFTKSVKNLTPSINKNDLIKISSGIRAQILTNKGELLDDFFIEKEGNIINVINAPSPAATSCFAISNEIVNKYLD